MNPGVAAQLLLTFLSSPILFAGCADRTAGSTAQANQENSQTAKADGGAVSFVDVTKDSGLAFRHVNGASGKFYYPETFGAGAAFVDYDQDGWLDVFLVNGDRWPEEASKGNDRPTLALYRNERNGKFTDVTKQAGLEMSIYGMGVAVGDYDNDGHDDLYVTALDRSILLRNEYGKHLDTQTPTPYFRDVTSVAGVGNEGHWGTSAAWLDYDIDGRLDLFVCNYVLYNRNSEQVCRQGTERIYCGPLVYSADSCRLYRNLDGGRFRDVTQEAGIRKTTGKSLGVAVWDIDGDRYPEIIVANDLTPNYLFRTNGRGGFAEVALDSGFAYGGDGLARSGMGIDVADTRNDGKSAIFVSNFAREPNSLFELEGPFTFADRSYESGMGESSLQSLGFGLFFFDYDNDGWKDAFVTNGHIQPAVAKFEPSQTFEQRPLLFRNQRDGTFDEVSRNTGDALKREEVGRGAVCGDYDNDGDSDILVTTNNGPARLLRNDGGNRASWLTIYLRGSKSNRNGFGAHIKLTAGGITQRDQVRSGSSYLSASDQRLHFGLGSAGQAEEIEVRWPSGIIDRIQGVKANQILVIDEGKGARGDDKRGQLN